MNDKQLTEILQLIETNYKNFYKDFNKNDRALMMKTWKYHFNNIPLGIMFKALMDFMSINKNFPPTIAHINELLVNMLFIEERDEYSSWEEIVNYVSGTKYIYYKGTNEYKFDNIADKFNEVEKEVITKAYYKKMKDTYKYGTETAWDIEKNNYIKRYKEVKVKLKEKKAMQIKELPQAQIEFLVEDIKLIG